MLWYKDTETAGADSGKYRTAFPAAAAAAATTTDHINRLIMTGLIHQLIHSQHTSQKKESSDIGTEERKKFMQRNWGSNPGPVSMPSCSTWIFFVLPFQCQCFLSSDWCVGNGLTDVFIQSGSA